jgi:hypothetical protein
LPQRLFKQLYFNLLKFNLNAFRLKTTPAPALATTRRETLLERGVDVRNIATVIAIVLVHRLAYS